MKRKEKEIYENQYEFCYELFFSKIFFEFQVFLVIDWAMKWLEKKYRQSQTEFFGMRGLPWHLTHVVRQQPSHSSDSSQKLFQNRTFCHSFDNCIQNGATVVSILQDVFIRLKHDHPEIETAFVRSDNAGCYHGADTLLAVKELYETTGILIRRVDFSEAQAGKGPCDRKAAVIKGEIRRYVDEKHDCTTSAEFVTAAKSTHNLSIVSCSLPPSTDKTTKAKWDGIKKFSNIEFIPCTMQSSSSSIAKLSSNSIAKSKKNLSSINLQVKAWRAFDIGVGKIFEWSNLNTVQSITPLIIDPAAQHLNHEWKSESAHKGKTYYIWLSDEYSIIFFFS